MDKLLSLCQKDVSYIFVYMYFNCDLNRCIHVIMFLDYSCSVVYQLQLLSSWGDPYYIGLNGLEVYDEAGIRISLTENSIHPN